MEIILDYAGIVLGLLSLILSWYYGTKNSRKQRKILEYEKELSKLDNYAKSTGYKNMIHDCFASLFYSMSLLLITVGFERVVLIIISHEASIVFVKQVASGFYIGAGLVLFDMFITLARAYNLEESKSKISKKIESLQKKA
ncbi:hypothetical protein N9Y67_01965 [Pseudomonadota bacterium]|nr:hypothetical protein [Pseudomonadota bacterium]